MKTLFKYLFIYVAFVPCLTSCFAPLKFENINYSIAKPVVPDYSLNKFWLALPSMIDSADHIISGSGIEDLQKTAKADVFYIHPTTYIYGKSWNSNLNDSLSYISESFPVKNQASIFNGSCRVYAPRYRQAEFLTYVATQKRKKQVFDVAYTDVKNAFLYYLNMYNEGRPFIIASHSQGTDHAVRLCNEIIEDDSLLRKRFIVAYLVGSIIKEDDFSSLVPCDSANQTNCYVTWNTVRWGDITFFGKPVTNAVCVNPLTWKRTREAAPKTLNAGGVSIYANKIDKELADAKISPNGLLWMHRPKRAKIDYPRINKRNYHSLDYNWFYMNVRNNVSERIEAYLFKTDYNSLLGNR